MAELEAIPTLSGQNDSLERRYVALVGLARRLTSTRDWADLASLAVETLGGGDEAAVRIWAITADGMSEVAHASTGAELPEANQLELKRAALADELTEGEHGVTMIGLHADGVSLGVCETIAIDDLEMLEAAAPLLACRFSVLAGQGVDGVLCSPQAVEAASDVSNVIADFAQRAKRLLDHDRLSVYLLTHDGRAFERFAVATSTIVPGEGVLIPFNDVGLKHIVLTDEPLISTDLGGDPRLAGREDRVIARAGFRGLLSVPLRRNGRPFGVLNFVSRTPGFYRQEDIPIAEQIAEQVGIFVDNLRLQRRMQAFVRLEASERERARLARDLYHTVAQTVREIEQSALSLEVKLDGDKRPYPEAERIRELAQLELAGMRRAVIDLDPPDLETNNLEEVVEKTLDCFREQGRPEPRLQVRGDAVVLPGSVQRATYRILQEALMNTRLHAEASAVVVSLDFDRDLTLLVEDDGCGFEVAEATRASGLGLRHMRDRAEVLGGQLTIESAPGEGTSIKLVVPRVQDPVDPAVAPARGLADAAEAEGALRVMVAEDNALVRAGLCRLVERSVQMRVVGEASSVEEVHREAPQLHPDVIVLGTALADGGIGAMVAAMREESPNSAILAISEGGPAGDKEVIQAGADGVIHPAINEECFGHAVRAVAEGTRVFAGSEGSAEAQEAEAESLSERERDVLALVAAGYTNAQIGGTLYLATKTVERQVATIVRKLNARNRSHAAAIAIARRIVQLPEDGADEPSPP